MIVNYICALILIGRAVILHVLTVPVAWPWRKYIWSVTVTVTEVYYLRNNSQWTSCNFARFEVKYRMTATMTELYLNNTSDMFNGCQDCTVTVLCNVVSHWSNHLYTNRWNAWPNCATLNTANNSRGSYIRTTRMTSHGTSNQTSDLLITITS